MVDMLNGLVFIASIWICILSYTSGRHNHGGHEECSSDSDCPFLYDCDLTLHNAQCEISIWKVFGIGVGVILILTILGGIFRYYCWKRCGYEIGYGRTECVHQGISINL